jgi:serine protease Do
MTETKVIDLFASCLPMLRKAARRMFRNRQDSEDAVQDGLLLALRKLHQFQGRSTFSTWLHSIVRHSSRMHYRAATAHQTVSLEAELTDRRPFLHEFGLVETPPSPEDICIRKKRSGILRKATEELRARYSMFQPVAPKWISASLSRMSDCTVLAAFVCLGCAHATLGQEHPTDELRKVNESVQALIKSVSPSVVQILVTGFGTVGESDNGNTGVVIGRQSAIGSGFVVDGSGYIITNAHVVSGAQRIQVVFPEVNSDSSARTVLAAKGRVVPAQIVGVTQEMDLALLKVEAESLQALPVAAYRDLRQGELVFAFGSPEGLRNSVTMGVVSSTARQTDPDSPLVYIQTDAPINPGNSGGPLVNVKGEVVGVNTFIVSQSGGNEGLGFAIPSRAVSLAYAQLRKYGHMYKSEIGIGLQTITLTLAAALSLPRNTGVIISDILPGGPAEAVGLRIGDVLLSIDDSPADSLPYVAFHFWGREDGEKVHLVVQRQEYQLTFDVPVVEQKHDIDQVAALADPSKNLVQHLGIVGLEIDKRIAPMLPELRDPYGIVVAARTADSGVGVPLETGDVIRTLNGEPMTTLDRLRETLAKLGPGSSVALQIQRNDHLMFVAITME